VKKPLGIIALLVLLPLLMARTALADLNEGLVGYWPFSGNANDESGNGNHGLVSKPVLTEDRFGNADSAYQFDGINDRIVIPSSESLNPADQLTIAFWFKLNQITNRWSPIIFKGGFQYLDDGSEREYTVWVGNSPHFLITSAGDDSGNLFVESNTISSGEWVFYTAVIDRRNHVMKAYINGELDTRMYDSYSSFNNNNYELEFGGSGEGHSNFSPFNGVLDEVRIYNRAFSDIEVMQLFSGKAPPPSVLTLTQEEFDTAKREAHEAGRQACINAPLSCGISPTQEQLDTAKSQGHEAGRQACITDPLSCGISSVPGGTATFSFADNILRIPTIEVSAPLIGTQVYKADMLLIPSEAPFGFHFEIQMLEQTQ
jgi:hypothetical protein